MSFGTGSSGLGIFGRIKTGWTLTKDSLGVIRDHPELMVFPLLAGVSSAFFFVVFFVPLFAANLIGVGLEYVVLLVLYFVTTFFSTYFSAALVHAANEAFHGREPGVIDSMRAVSGRIGPILVWSAVAATVSVLLKVLEESDNPLASIARSLFALGWAVTTFFVVPVIVFEEVSVKSMFTKSAGAFKDTWGETLGAGFGITLIVSAVGIVLIVLALGLSLPLAAVFPAAGIFSAILLVGAAVAFAYLLSQTIWGIVKTALYVYAREGRKPEQFGNFDFETLDGRTERRADPGGGVGLDD